MYESSKTKANLLDAARRLFAERGYDNTSIRAITSLAQANLGAVTYHFQSKENLYNEVLESKAKPLAELLTVAASSPGTPLDRIEAMVRQFFGYLMENREMPSLLLHEISMGRPVPEPIRRTMMRSFGLLIELITQGQREGSIVRGRPQLLAISVVAQPAYTAVLLPALGNIVHLDVQDPVLRKQVIDHIVSFLRRGLTPAGDKEH